MSSLTSHASGGRWLVCSEPKLLRGLSQCLLLIQATLGDRPTRQESAADCAICAVQEYTDSPDTASRGLRRHLELLKPLCTQAKFSFK